MSRYELCDGARCDAADGPPVDLHTALEVTQDGRSAVFDLSYAVQPWVEPGTYRIARDAWSVTDFSVTIPSGWVVTHGHIFSYSTDHPGAFGFYGVVVKDIFLDACHGEEVPVKVGPGAEALIAALRKQAGPDVSAPVKTTLGGRPATRIDLRVPNDMTPDCRMMGENLQVWYSAPADKYLVLIPDSVTTVYALDVDGSRQVFVAQRRSTTTIGNLSELQSVLDSLRID